MCTVCCTLIECRKLKNEKREEKKWARAKKSSKKCRLQLSACCSLFFLLSSWALAEQLVTVKIRVWAWVIYRSLWRKTFALIRRREGEKRAARWENCTRRLAKALARISFVIRSDGSNLHWDLRNFWKTIQETLTAILQCSWKNFSLALVSLLFYCVWKKQQRSWDEEIGGEIRNKKRKWEKFSFCSNKRELRSCSKAKQALFTRLHNFFVASRPPANETVKLEWETTNKQKNYVKVFPFRSFVRSSSSSSHLQSGKQWNSLGRLRIQL